MTGSVVIALLSFTAPGVWTFLPFLGQGLGVEYINAMHVLQIDFTDWGGLIGMQEKRRIPHPSFWVPHQPAGWVFPSILRGWPLEGLFRPFGIRPQFALCSLARVELLLCETALSC